ncbi:MAG: heme-binding protein, partial [Gammaproteobacteria bacterium]
VCAVFRTGNDRGDQWPGSRVISAQKASTANSFSLEGAYPNAGVGRALSTGNLYGLVQPGGSLFGLQFSNPVDTSVAYGRDGSPGYAEGQSARRYGLRNDPLVGDIPGGVNVFGGGLALYNEAGDLVGAIGVSGDTSCADHIIAWKTRDAIGLDNIPGGVGDGFVNDNLILNNPPTPNSFEHPSCGFGEDDIINNLATSHPIGS